MTMASSIDMSRMDSIKAEPFDLETNYNGAGSDTENLPSPRNLIDAPPADYWFGTRLFEGIVAQEIFMHSPMDESIPNMDSKFQKVIRNFPFPEAINKLQSGSPRLYRAGYLSVGNDDYNTFLSLAGTTMRLGNVQEKCFLFTTIRTLADKHHSSERRTSPPSRGNMALAMPPQTGTQASTVMESEADMARYSSRLHEKLTLRGWELKTTWQRESENPPTFRAILTFQGLSFSGIGRSKQMAKHQAAKEAWNFLQGQQEQSV